MGTIQHPSHRACPLLLRVTESSAMGNAEAVSKSVFPATQWPSFFIMLVMVYSYVLLVSACLVSSHALISSCIPAMGSFLVLGGKNFWLDTSPWKLQGLRVDATRGAAHVLTGLCSRCPALLGGELKIGCFPSHVLTKWRSVTQGLRGQPQPFKYSPA